MNTFIIISVFTVHETIAHKKQSTLQYIETLLEGYDQYEPPPLVDAESSHSLLIRIKIKDIFDISEHHSSFCVRYFMTLRWKDSRIKFIPPRGDNLTQREKLNIFDVDEEKWRLLPVKVMKEKGQLHSFSVWAENIFPLVVNPGFIRQRALPY